MLVGLSAGTQAAAIGGSRPRRWSATWSWSARPSSPHRRNTLKMLAIFLTPNPNEEVALFSELLPDWSRAGPVRILRGFRSSIRLPLEDVLGAGVGRADRRARRLRPADDVRVRRRARRRFGGTLRIAPSGAHSWPTQDPEGFLRLVDDLVGVRR